MVQLLLMSIGCPGQETNLFYLTLARSDLGSTWPMPTNEAEIAEILKNPESWPAEYYPGGFWGEPMEGFQVSVRFEKDAYARDEAINAIVLVRNVSSNALEITESRPEPGIIINIVDAQNRAVAKKGDPMRYSSDHSVILGVRRQRKYVMNLSSKYDLSKPGTYYLNAVFAIRKPDGVGWTHIPSGTAFFTVLSSSSGSGESARSPQSTNFSGMSGNRPIPAKDAGQASSALSGITQATSQSSANKDANPTAIASAAAEAQGAELTSDSTSLGLGARDKFLMILICFLLLVVAFVLVGASRRKQRP